MPADIEDRDGKAHAVYCDHTNMDEVRQLFKRIKEEQGGRLDILVNNAFSAAPVNLSRKLQFLRTYKLHLNHRPII
jgi:dehydrogenase/reductase SDR family protein 1